MQIKTVATVFIDLVIVCVTLVLVISSIDDFSHNLLIFSYSIKYNNSIINRITNYGKNSRYKGCVYWYLETAYTVIVIKISCINAIIAELQI